MFNVRAGCVYYYGTGQRFTLVGRLRRQKWNDFRNERGSVFKKAPAFTTQFRIGNGLTVELRRYLRINMVIDIYLWRLLLRAAVTERENHSIFIFLNITRETRNSDSILINGPSRTHWKRSTFVRLHYYSRVFESCTRARVLASLAISLYYYLGHG